MECKSSLEDYVQTVGTNCGGKGDLATERRIKNGLNNTYARVWTVGQMFEYTYAQSCAKDEYVVFPFKFTLYTRHLHRSRRPKAERKPEQEEKDNEKTPNKPNKQNPRKTLTSPTRNGDYCPLTSTTLPSTAANCTSPCSVSFYTNAHDFLPASEKQFLYSYLTTQTAYWIKQYQQGWKALVACGAAVGAPALATASSGGGFAQVTGLPAGAESTGVSGDLSDEGVTSPVTGTSSGGGGVATGTGSTTSATTAAASSTVTVLQDKNGGSVVEVDLKSVIALGVLGLIAAAILL